MRRRPDSFLDTPGARRDMPRAPGACARCGGTLRKGSGLCRKCADEDAAKTFPKVLEQARRTANAPEAQVKRAATLRRNAAAMRDWNPQGLPTWLTAEVYERRIVPRLKALRTVDVARGLSVSVAYAAPVKTGERTPHPRHWFALARLAGCRGDS
jgi:hypothetical protein